MNSEELAKYLAAGTTGSNPYAEGAEARKTAQAKADIENKTSQENYRKSIEAIQSGNLPEGSGVSFTGNGGVSVTRGINTGAQATHQAQTLLKTAQGVYKPLTDQLDAAQSTLDALNQGNSTSDKLALINEARLAAGQGGSKAISHMVDILSGGSTAASSYQDKINWLQNTPNIPTMQPAQRDAIRESVYQRLGQLEQMHNQAMTQLQQQGPIIAPQSDYGGIINSFATPTKQKLESLKKMQSDYNARRSAMGAQNPISQPAEANPNPTTFDKLRSFFTGGQPSPQPQQVQTASPQQPQGAMSFEDWKKANGR